MANLIVLTVTGFTFLAVIYVYLTRQRYSTIDAFLTARGTMGTWLSTATVFASIMGAWILFTPAEAGTWGGITAITGYAVAQAVAIMIYAKLGPRMRRIAPHGSTLVEFVYYRFGRPMYAITLVVGIFYMAVFLCAELTGIALAIKTVVGFPLWVTALLVGSGTLIYTAYGGIRGSIFTDAVQAIIIIPALLLVFTVAVLTSGGLGTLFSSLREIDPSLLSMGHRGGWNFALTLLIAIVSANLFHQGFWSRVYACKDVSVVRKSFLYAGVVIVPVVFLAGTFGLMAVSRDLLDTPSAALFEVVLSVTPLWVLLVLLVLALALVMSSTDTLINAIAAVFTVDIARFFPAVSTHLLRTWSRILTAILCVAVIGAASQGYSVLYLFLLADLVCAAAVFPTFYGLYSPRLTGQSAALAVLSGIAAGALIFPDPAFTRGDLLSSFLAALLVPVILSLILAQFSRSTVDLGSLAEKAYDIKM
ncbi:MAG: hypothetical protein Q7J85_03600 [Bacillota bacterium]|nr:hypothetical protein [Bacillota bacterium]